MVKISALPPMTTGNGDDEAPVVDDSAGSTKKFSFTVLKEWLQSVSTWVTSTMIAGIDKSVLTTDSNPYKFRVTKTSAQNTSAGSYVKVTFNTETFDTNNNFDSTDNHRYTVPVDGYYQINGYVNLAANGGNFVLAALYKNGTVYQRGDQINSTGACGVTYSDLIYMVAGDYIELFVFASNTVALDIGGGQQAYFSGYLVSRT